MPPVIAGVGSQRISVSGVVQGVGFRPFVHRLALRLSLQGWVRNVSGAVEIAVQGTAQALAAFREALRDEAPPLARIDAVHVVDGPALLDRDFRIVESRDDRETRQLISPDIATCARCEAELYDPTDRRAGYAFTTCTDCGPRHSVILAMPYDRERTTMRDFEQCPECLAEYGDIAERRYHSETNSCPACGPRPSLLIETTGERHSLDPIADAARMLREGAIVAVRGIGGFHLAVDATSESAVRRLRDRKHRDGKPLAVIVRRLEDAARLAFVSRAEAAWLTSPQRPIVILQMRPGAPVATTVSDGLGTIGIMLAYSPLHMLLLDQVRRPLVMTSGNPTDLPLAVTMDDARATLGSIADAFLTHDRAIAAPIDDSVLRVVRGQPVFLRRARGFAPLPVALPFPARQPVVAVGAHLKNTFTIAAGREAFVSQHIGDLETLETAQHWERSLAAFCGMLRIAPRVAARDLHPDYVSTRLAAALGLGNTIAVQHHHAHVAAVAAEHGVVDRVLGLSFDGTGFGQDEAIWGGEFLIADLVSARRASHLRYAPLPGGDAGARQGWRAAVGYACAADKDDGDAILAALRPRHGAVLEIARQQCRRDLNAPRHSSMGRLFDAAAAITGVCGHSRFEGEAAMRLESLASQARADPIAMPIMPFGNRQVLDPGPVLAELARRSLAGEDAARLAAAFHASVAEGSAELALRLAEGAHLDTVVLAGGVFQNAVLRSDLESRLLRAGMRVLAAKQLPANDGAISYGQAAVAAARLAMEGRKL